MVDNTFENKVVLVTGAGRGIGKEIVQAFASRSAHVCLVARTKSQLDKVQSETESSGTGRIHVFPCDITRSEQVGQLVESVIKLETRLDILVNCAGVAIFKPFVETSEMDFDTMIAANLKGPFLVTKAFLPILLEQQSGHIVNIISSAGKKAFTNCAAYCASKFGLTGLTRVLREEVRHKNIHVTAIYPGAVDSSLWDAIDGDWDRNRMIRPANVAQSVIHACLNSRHAMIEEIDLMPVEGDL